MALKDFLDAVAPRYASPIQTGEVDILEHESDALFKKVVWKDADFQHMDHQLAKDLKSFFETAGSPEVFRKDCDGVVLFETEGKKYMFLTELKSSFGTEKLMKAKTQIVSSFIKTNMILHLSSCYKLEDYIIKGFIVGYPPRRDFLVDLYRRSMLPGGIKSGDYDLAKRLFINNASRSITLRPTDFFCLRGLPLGERGIFPKIDLHFIEVNVPDSEITLSVKSFLQ